MACLRWNPVTATNSSRMRPFSARLPLLYRSMTAATSSSRVAMLTRLIAISPTPSRPGAFQMRQRINIREHFWRGNATLILIVALHASQFRAQAGRKRLTIGRMQPIESLLPIAPGRLEVTDALRHQQSLDAVRVLAPLDHKPRPFARPATGILLLGRGHVHHAADLRLAALQRHQRAQEPSRIQPVRLGPPRPAIHQQAGGIQNPVLDTTRTQPSMPQETTV